MGVVDVGSSSIETIKRDVHWLNPFEGVAAPYQYLDLLPAKRNIESLPGGPGRSSMVGGTAGRQGMSYDRTDHFRSVLRVHDACVRPVVWCKEEPHVRTDRHRVRQSGQGQGGL